MTNERTTLTTARLVLEPPARRHAEALLAYERRNRAHLEPWEPARDERDDTLEAKRAAIASYVADAERGLSARFLAFEPGRPDVVASVNLSNVRRGVVHGAILSYSVDARCEGQGFATECAGAVVRYAFDVLNLHRVEASYQPHNERSARVLRKLGFVVEGYAREYLLLGGAWRDGVLVGLINAAWRAPEGS